MDSIRIVYMGTPEFAKYPLKSLVENGFSVVGVLSQEDKARDRGKKLKPTPVKELALELGLKVYQPKDVNSDEAIDILTLLNPDLIVVVAYGQILKAKVYNMPRLRTINLHASLLPRWRGASPINHAIMSGDKETGVSIMYVGKGLDKGDVILTSKVPLDDKIDYPTLHDKLSTIGSEALVEGIRKLSKEGFVPTKQDDSLATYAPILSKDMGLIDWELPAKDIHNRVRGLNPWPGTYFYHRDTKIKIIKSYFKSGPRTQAPGEIVDIGDFIDVQCTEGILSLLMVQKLNGKVMDAKSFLNGYPLKVGDSLR